MSAQEVPGPARRRLRRRWVAGGVGGLAVVALTGGLLVVDGAGPGTPPAAAGPGLRPLGTCEGVEQWYRDSLLPHVTPHGLDDGPSTSAWAELFATGTDAVTDGAAPAGADTTAGQQSDPVGVGGTGTNLQEAGVDEPDLAKTADGRLYTVVGSELVVLDVTGPAPVQVGRVSLPAAGGGGEHELLLVGGQVVVFGTGELPGPPGGTAVPGPTGSFADPGRGPAPQAYPAGRPTTVTTVVDVTVEQAPRVVYTDEVEGRYLSARLTGATVRLVTTSSPRFDFPSSGAVDEARTRSNERHLRGLTAAALLPGTVVTAADGSRTVRRRTDCGGVARPQEWAGAGVISVRTLSPSSPRVKVQENLVVADGDLVYASADRLWVGTLTHQWGGGGAAGSTELHGFDTSGQGRTQYLASGRVRGVVPGRWALSAVGDTLRVVTTQQAHRRLTRGWVPSQSGVTVLQEQGGELVPRGQVHGLGVDEQVHAVRWFQDTAYVVTFRQTDPLYVLDLADPDAPRVTGELKIPGFSSYLHPLGGYRLLGVGQDADPATGWAGAAQVSLFDVSDPAAPSRLALWQDPGGSSRSPLADDSRQFSYLPDERTALVPLRGGSVDLVALRVDEDTITPTGSLDVDGWGGSEWEPRQLRRAISLGDGRVVLIDDVPVAGRTLTTALVGTLEVSGALTLPPS